MRTTITIDDDLMRKLKERAQKTGRSFKDITNSVIRKGLNSSTQTPQKGKYHCAEYSLGEPSYYDLDKALEIAEALEDEEIVRKLQLGK